MSDRTNLIQTWRTRRIWARRAKAFVLLVLIIAAVVCSAVCAEFIIQVVVPRATQWIEPTDQPALAPKRTLWFALILAGVSVALLAVVAKVRRKWFGAYAAMLEPRESTVARKVVIMGVSPVDRNPLTVPHDDPLSVLTPALSALANAGFLNASLDIQAMREQTELLGKAPKPRGGCPRYKGKKHERDDGAASPAARPTPPPGMHRWVQNLRALRDHVLRRTLRVVVLVPSREIADEARLMKAWLERMLAPWSEMSEIEVIISSPEGLDYADYTSVIYGLDRARGDARTFLQHHSAGPRESITDRDICIDSTAGFATFSIGCAVATLNHEMLYSYVTTKVNTRDPQTGESVETGGQVKYYDARIDLAPFIHEV